VALPVEPQRDATAPTTAPATGQPALNPDAPQVAVDFERNWAKLERVTNDLAIARQRRSVSDGLLADANSRLLAAQAALAGVQARVRLQAVAAYQQWGAANSTILSTRSVLEAQSVDRYAKSALAVDSDALTAAQKLVDEVRDERDHDADVQQQLAGEEQSLQSDSDQLVALRTRESAQLEGWGAVPVMGDSILDADQLSAWYATTGATPSLAPGTTIHDIANLYVIEGRAEHVRGDLAFAQAMIETGSFSVAAGNNYSGIGVCDSCTGGNTFATPLDGIRAQIQLLKNYADPDSRASGLANVPDAGLYGSDARKASSLYDSFFLKGKAPLWNQMGHGNWATDATYASKVIGLYVKMLASAQPPKAPGSPPQGYPG
jgi:hypothetical protein